MSCAPSAISRGWRPARTVASGLLLNRVLPDLAWFAEFPGNVRLGNCEPTPGRGLRALCSPVREFWPEISEPGGRSTEPDLASDARKSDIVTFFAKKSPVAILWVPHPRPRPLESDAFVASGRERLRSARC